MIYTLIYFMFLDICILLIFVSFCLSEFINNCKSSININSKSNLVIRYNKVSSQFHSIHQVEKAHPFELTPETTFVEV